MKHKSVNIVGTLILASLSQSHAAALVPLVATGWNQDIIIGSTETIAGRTGTMDQGAGGGDATWYGVGYNNGAPLTGLPVGPTLSVATPTDLSFELQSFTANNSILDGGTLTLTSPVSLARLALIGSTGNGTSAITVTVNFTTGAPEVFSGGAVDQDWFGASPYAFAADGRVNTNDGGFQGVNEGNLWRLYQSVFTLTNTSTVLSIDIADGGGGHNAILAISGEAIPEPSSLMLVGLSTLGMFFRRR